VSTCDDCKQALFSPSDRQDTFLEQNKRPGAALPHPLTSTTTTTNSKQMEVVLSQKLTPNETHELAEGILLMRNPTFTNPRTFTKPTSAQSLPSFSTSTTSIPFITKPDIVLGFANSLEPNGVLSVMTAQTNPQTACDLLPYLIRNFHKFMKSRKTLGKVLAIFCVVSWCVDDALLLWYHF
jgi:hypothetical protein